MGKHRPTSTPTPKTVAELVARDAEPDEMDTEVFSAISPATTGRIPRLIVAGAVVLGTAASAAAVAPIVPSSAPPLPTSSDIPINRGGSVSAAFAADRLSSLAASRSARASEQAAASQVQAASEEAARASQEAAEASAQAPAPTETPEPSQDVTSTAAAPTENPPVEPSGPAAEIAVQTAMAQLGKPYVWAAEGPDSFDCSGLVLFAYRAAGVSLPRVSSDQATAGVPVSRDELQPGDLVAFYSPVSHIGIYIGNGEMVHAPEPGDVVKVTDIDLMPIVAMRRVA